MNARSIASLAMLPLLAAIWPACGGESSSATSPGDAGDGKYHPEGNGEHITEDAACQALADAQSSIALNAGCVATSRPCPDLLRAVFGTACMEYDQGSVQGCIDYYAEQTTCGALTSSFDECVVTPFPGTEPAGCPAPPP